MKTALTIIMGLLANVSFATTGMAQDTTPAPEIGRKVIITGCVHRGTTLGSFVLLGVSERPADPTAPITPVPIAIYWLDSVKQLEPLVGKMAEITGKVTSHDANPGTITIDINPNVTLSTDVKVESEHQNVTSKRFDYQPQATPSPQSSLIVTRPVYNLAVEDASAVTGSSNDPPCKFKEKVVILATELADPKVEEQLKILASEKDEEKVVVLAFEDLHFDFDKSTLTPKAQTILKRNVQLLKDNPDTQIRIAGYTSASGTEEYNQKLSVRRAKAVEDYLMNEGVVSSARLSTIGYGETNPADYESAPEDLYSREAKANMRVLFEIVVK